MRSSRERLRRGVSEEVEESGEVEVDVLSRSRVGSYVRKEHGLMWSNFLPSVMCSSSELLREVRSVLVMDTDVVLAQAGECVADAALVDLLDLNHGLVGVEGDRLSDLELCLDTNVYVKVREASPSAPSLPRLKLINPYSGSLLTQVRLGLNSEVKCSINRGTGVSYDFLGKLRFITAEELIRGFDIGINLNLRTDIGERLLTDAYASLAGLGLGIGASFLEFLFDVTGGGSGLVLPRSFGCWGSDVPVFVVLEGRDSSGNSSEWFLVFAYLIAELLREITQCSRVRVFVRSASGGGLLEEEALDTVSPYSMRPLDLKCRVEVFDYRGEASSHTREVLEVLRGRLRTLYSHGPGAVVLAVSEEYGRELADLLTRERSDFEVPTRVFRITPTEKLRGVGEVGFMKLLLGIKNSTCNSINSCMRTYREVLDHTIESLSILVRRQVSREGEQLDYWQYPLKVATYAAIAKNIIRDALREKRVELSDLGRIRRAELLKLLAKELKGKVHVEEPLSEGENGKVIPDIWFESRDGKATVAVEVESLVGTGDPMKKIDEIIEKYRGLGSRVSELWVVVKPLDVVLHYRALMERVKLYNEVLNKDLPKFRVKVINYVGSHGKGRPNVLMWDLTDLRSYVRSVLSKEVVDDF